MKKLLLTALLILSFAVSSANGMLIKNSATSVITYFVFRDRTNGNVDTGVTIANLEMYYIEDQAAISGDVFVGAHGAATDAYTTGECYNCGWGVYRFDWPDGAFDGGIGKRVQLIVIDGDGGAFTEVLEVELSAAVDLITIAGTAAETVLEAEAVDALESFDLDHLLSVTTSVAADDDLEAFVSAGTVMAHLMGIAADVTEYDATQDSMEAQGTHLNSVSTLTTSDNIGINWGDVTNPTTTVGLTNTTVGIVTTLTGHTNQTGDSYAVVNSGTIGLAVIEGQTDDIGVAGAGLTAINLPNQTMDVTGNITGNLSGSVGSVTAGVDLVKIHGSPITETTPGRFAANWDTFYDNADSATAKTLDDVGGDSATDIADAVLDELVGDHQTSRTLGWYIRKIYQFLGN